MGHWWFSPHVFVKPVTDCPLFPQWLVLVMTPWQSIRDDWRRFGWRVALYNAWQLVKIWRGRW